MEYPKIEFITSDLHFQANHLCFLAKHIERGSYQKFGFLVLPFSLAGSRVSVYFPDFAYSTTFWREIVKSRQIDFGGQYPEFCIREATKHLKEASFKAFRDCRAKILKWQRREKEFFYLGGKFLNLTHFFPRIKKIACLITDYGTAGSFYPHKKGRKWEIFFTFRRDFPISEIARTLFLCFYRVGVKGVENFFCLQRETVADYLLTETAFSRLFKSYASKREPFDSQEAEKLTSQSQRYLDQLGFPSEPVLALSTGGEVTALGKSLDRLTSQEIKVLTELIKYRGRMVNYDQIAKIIWGEEYANKFSLYAIAKIIEGLRRKLRRKKINKNLILTVYGQGYLLND